MTMTLFEYLDEKEKSRRRSCIAGVKLFLDSIYDTQRVNHGYTTQEEKDRYEQMGAEYLGDTKRDHTRDLIIWKKNSTISPGTIRTYLGGVKEFLEVHGASFTPEQEKRLRNAFKGGEEAPDDAPDHVQIRSYLEHADVRMKAIALLLSSTGMRIGELLSIRESQIDFERRMITLKAKDTKTKTGRNVFFSKEAELALNQFLKVRSKYIVECNLKAKRFGGNTGTNDDGRIFPYDQVSINRAWNRALKRAGQYQKNDRGIVKFHPHSLRQFFSTQMRKNGCPDSVVEVLLGHKLYLGTYTRYTPGELQEMYEKYSPCLLIGTDDMVRKTISAIAEKTLEHNTTIKKLEDENVDLRLKLIDMEQKMIAINALDGIHLSEEDRTEIAKKIIALQKATSS